MFKNYLITAVRNLKRNPFYTVINVFGLAVGMACCIVIMLFVQDELSYDRYHDNADRIYRITTHWEREGKEFNYAPSNGTLAPKLLENFPEVENFTRIDMHRWFVIKHGETTLTTDPFFADPSIFDVFTFPLIRGNKENALATPSNVVISEDLAKKFFGEHDPIGNIISLFSLDSKYDLQVTGVMRNVPNNSHFHFDFLLPIEHLRLRAKDKANWLRHCTTYLLLKENTSPDTLAGKILANMDKLYGRNQVVKREHRLQPLTSIHLNSDLTLELEQNSNLTPSYFLMAVAFIILLIACINFMNLATARSSRRYREVGMRKVVGAGRIQLFRQFLGESILLAFIALFIGLALATLFIPLFNSLVHKTLTLNFGYNLFLFAGLVLLSLIVGILAGVYPAVFISSFRPVDILICTEEGFFKRDHF
jgi:putative ABC transport system permease protein